MSKETILKALSELNTIENSLLELNKQTKELRERKKIITKSVVGVMKTNSIDCFDLKDSKIIYTKNNTREPINKEYVKKTISTFIQHKNIKMQNQDIDELCEYIFKNREVISKDKLSVKHNKTRTKK